MSPSPLITLTNYWMPNCGFCTLQHPTIVDLANKYKDKLTLQEVNVVEDRESAQKVTITGLPLLVVRSGEEEIGRLEGYFPYAVVESFVKGFIE